MISRAMEDYLKAVFLLAEGTEKVTTSKLAQRMHCAAASVTNMLQKLADLKLVSYTPYQGVSLTSAGNKIALEVLRHHRLIELYLQEVLGYSWDEVHAEAEKLEHVISEELEERIATALGDPTHDPHGHPIPGRGGEIPRETARPLWETSERQTVRVTRVDDSSPEALRYLASIGVLLQTEIRVLGRAPFNGPISIEVSGQEHSLGEELARQIHVTNA